MECQLCDLLSPNLMQVCRMICVVIPTLNSKVELDLLLRQLDIDARVVVTDGGSIDGTLDVAVLHGAVMCVGALGRGTQLKRGVSWAFNASWILVLHADSRLPENLYSILNTHIDTYPEKAGYFDLKFESNTYSARILEWLVRIRCKLFGLPYGDQGLLISRVVYESVGGYDKLPLFEDVALIRKLGKHRLKRLGAPLVTSAAKFERDGFFRRGWANFRRLRRYLRGENPHDIAKDYS